MPVTTMEGLIRRRILVNFRVDPAVARRLVPDPFEITTVDGQAMAGICLIRLERVRPAHLGLGLGLASENVAYRVAVEWRQDGTRRSGVYIPRRDTSSALQARLGGRVFPGTYGRARIEASDVAGRIDLAVDSADGAGDVRLIAAPAADFPKESVFESLEAASAFFRAGALGYSPRGGTPRLDGLRLDVPEWLATPLAVERVTSSFFDSAARFPPGSAQFDNALIMRDARHVWHAEQGLERITPAAVA